MSRAFVKEVDDAPSPLLERAVRAAPNRVTPRGARLISEAVAALNEQLAAASTAASVIRRDLRYWLARQASMQVVTPDPQPRAVGFGSRATIRRRAVTSDVTIVGEDEAYPPAGLIAWTAPLARVLEGAEPGDVVELQASGRRQSITVVAVVASD